MSWLRPCCLTLLCFWLLAPAAAEAWTRAATKPGFPVNLGGRPVEESSVALGDVDGDGRLEIFVGDTSGAIACYSYRGQRRWAYRTNRIIKSSPSFGDVTGDGQPDIVVGLGADVNNRVAGGFLCLDARTGRRHWERATRDVYGGREGSFSNGVNDGVFGSANLTDLNHDGRPEIIITSWDHQIYVLNGQNGANFSRYWPYDFWDSSWGTPVVADINGDRRLEIVIGADLTASWVRGSFNGGRMWVFDLAARSLTNWPRSTRQTFYSSPAVGDINRDGYYEIVCGTGTYYQDEGHLVHAWNREGNELPGWPVRVGGYVFSSPALADMNGDGYLDVIVGCYDGQVYCIDNDGTIIWRTMLVDVNGGSNGLRDPRYHIRSSPVVADINGDGRLEVLVPFAWEVAVLDYRGRQLTGPRSVSYVANWSLFSSPAVADIDRDGYLDIVIGGGMAGGRGGLWAWPTRARSNAARPWPTFHKDFQRSGLVAVSGSSQPPPELNGY